MSARRNTTRAGLIFAALLLATTGTAVSGPAVAAANDGPEEHSSAATTVDWSAYRGIVVESPSVEFRENWLRDQNQGRATRVSERDAERLRTELAELFDRTFGPELAEDCGFTIVSEPARDVLRLVPRMVDVDIYAPETTWSGGLNRSYTDSSGRMTLELDVYDSVSEDLLLTTTDPRKSPRRGYLQWTTGVSNQGDARRIMQQWAADLCDRIGETDRQASD